MPIFIKLSDSEREEFFRDLKKETNVSWEKFYRKYKVSHTMFFNYLSGRYDIPEKLFDEWIRISKSKPKPNNIRKVIRQRFMRKDCPRFDMDEKLAEIFGILNGDGHISKFKYEICVVGDSREKDYFDYIRRLFENKFKMPFNFFIEPNRIKLRVYSIELSNILVSEYGLPKGNKMGKLKIPKQVLKSKKWTIAYIRGLFDTDGTIYKRRKDEMVVEISSADKKYLTEVSKVLSSFNFKVSLGEKHLTIYSQDDIKQFFKLIKPANPKHLKKYQKYLKLGARVI